MLDGATGEMDCGTNGEAEESIEGGMEKGSGCGTCTSLNGSICTRF
jgi:hypothetical protein